MVWSRVQQKNWLKNDLISCFIRALFKLNSPRLLKSYEMKDTLSLLLICVMTQLSCSFILMIISTSEWNNGLSWCGFKNDLYEQGLEAFCFKHVFYHLFHYSNLLKFFNLSKTDEISSTIRRVRLWKYLNFAENDRFWTCWHNRLLLLSGVEHCDCL